ncbi:MAG: RNA pseudouridine synthase [Flavobacteriales bacterium]|nr:RNA pseudouridine synthase [Flavobacteriales bacterium]
MSGVLVQKDKTGDKSLSDHIKSYIKIKKKKPGNVFLGVVHRIDRPTSGVIVFAKTSKALSRLNKQFVDRKVNKKYLAITNNINCLSSDKLKNWIIKNTKQNKSYIHSSPIPGSKIAILRYSLVKELDNYSLLEVIIETGRHHQIRAQLSNIGLTIKGDLKYGSKRSNKDGSIDLHAYKLTFNHPVTKNKIEIKAPFPKRQPWSSFLVD